jgi:hypothetical protein
MKKFYKIDNETFDQVEHYTGDCVEPNQFDSFERFVFSQLQSNVLVDLCYGRIMIHGRYRGFSFDFDKLQ